MFLEQIWSQGRMQSAVTRAHLSVYFLLTVAVCSGSVCVWGGGSRRQPAVKRRHVWWKQTGPPLWSDSYRHQAAKACQLIGAVRGWQVQSGEGRCLRQQLKCYSLVRGIHPVHESWRFQLSELLFSICFNDMRMLASLSAFLLTHFVSFEIDLLLS